MVISKLRKEKELLITKKTRKLEYLDHIMRNNQRYGLLKLILQGKIEGKRSVGIRWISRLKSFRDWFGVTSSELFRTLLERKKYLL